MDDLTKILTAVFGGVVLIAIAAVIVSRKSQAPQAIQAIGSSIGNVVAAAVNPVSANYGWGNGSSTFSTPALALSPLNDNSVLNFANSVVPGGFK